jgi:Tfp pilus assembly protein PilV
MKLPLKVLLGGTMSHRCQEIVSSAAPKAGFTLIETLIALLVIMMGFMAALVMQTGAIRSASVSENQILAVFLAETKIEEFKDFPPADFPDNTPVEEYFDTNGNTTEKPKAYFTRIVTLKRQCPTQFTHEVIVEVTWSKSSSLVYQSLIKASS